MDTRATKRKPLYMTTGFWLWMGTLGAFGAVIVFGVSTPERRENLWSIASKGDNIPIVFMLPIVAFYVWWAFHEAGRNDRLIEQGKRDEILKDMQR